MKELELKNNVKLWLKNTLKYNYYQWWQRHKLHIIDSKYYMVGVTQNKQVPYFHRGHKLLFCLFQWTPTFP